MDQPPHSTEKAIGALDAGIAPLQILLGRRRKEGKQAGRVGAIGGDEMLGIHDVLLRLRHLLYAALHDRRADLHSLTLRAPPPLLVGPHHFTGGQPTMRLAAIRLLGHHPLRQQTRKRFVHLDQAQVPHGLREETGIQQVQDCVLDTADVLVHRHPVVGFARIHGTRLFMRRTIPQKIPGRVYERVHRVRLPSSRTFAFGTFHFDEVLHLRQWGSPLAGKGNLLGQHDRKIGLRHRHCAARVAINDRNGCSPIALA